jgi:hypothetical protein
MPAALKFIHSCYIFFYNRYTTVQKKSILKMFYCSTKCRSLVEMTNNVKYAVL